VGAMKSGSESNYVFMGRWMEGGIDGGDEYLEEVTFNLGLLHNRNIE